MQPEVVLCRYDGVRLAVSASAPLVLGREHHSSMSPHISRHAATCFVGLLNPYLNELTCEAVLQ